MKTKHLGSRILWSLRWEHLGMHWVLSQLTWHSTSGWESVELCTHSWTTAAGWTTACSISKISRQLCQLTTGWQRCIRNGFMPHIMGHKLSHIYAREVRWNFEFDSWYSSKICLSLPKKICTVYTYFFDNVNFKRWCTSKIFLFYKPIGPAALRHMDRQTVSSIYYYCYVPTYVVRIMYDT